MYSAIRFRSATYTFRARQVLEGAGITAVVIRVPARLAGDGCGYMIKVKNGDLQWALTVLEREKIPHREIYSPYEEERL